MASRRQPLFELIGQGTSRAPARDPVHVEPPPEVERRRPREPDPDPDYGHEPAADADRSRGGGYRRISAPLPTVYALAAFVVVLAIVCFTMGYSIGENSAAPASEPEEQFERSILADALREVDATGGGATPSGSTGRTTPTPAPRNGPPLYLGASGPINADPRVEGSNYLELALLTSGEAEQAISFLASEGHDAMAAFVPRRGRYRLVSLELAVPGERYRAMQSDRQRVEREVERLGRKWKDAGGPSDFKDPLWRRHGG